MCSAKWSCWNASRISSTSITLCSISKTSTLPLSGNGRPLVRGDSFVQLELRRPDDSQRKFSVNESPDKVITHEPTCVQKKEPTWKSHERAWQFAEKRPLLTQVEALVHPDSGLPRVLFAWSAALKSIQEHVDSSLLPRRVK